MDIKERPLLMKGPMVTAALADIKTVTRRVNGLDEINFEAGVPSADMWKYTGIVSVPDGLHRFKYADGINEQLVKCPYGKPGDRLWVRETWRPSLRGIEAEPGWEDGIEYRADGLFIPMDIRGMKEDDAYRWKPSIFMPKWVCRLRLKITDISVQRLQDITPMDCIAEGALTASEATVLIPIAYMEDLWNSINAKLGHSWEQNDHVWVVRFNRVKKTYQEWRNEKIRSQASCYRKGRGRCMPLSEDNFCQGCYDEEC